MNRAVRWIPAATIAATLFTLSSLPGRTYGPSPFAGADKVVHATEYALLGAATVFAWERALASWLAATAFGATDELHQRWVPERSSDGWDLLADGVGAMLGVALTQAIRRRGRLASASPSEGPWPPDQMKGP